MECPNIKLTPLALTLLVKSCDNTSTNYWSTCMTMPAIPLCMPSSMVTLSPTLNFLVTHAHSTSITSVKSLALVGFNTTLLPSGLHDCTMPINPFKSPNTTSTLSCCCYICFFTSLIDDNISSNVYNSLPSSSFTILYILISSLVGLMLCISIALTLTCLYNSPSLNLLPL